MCVQTIQRSSVQPIRRPRERRESASDRSGIYGRGESQHPADHASTGAERVSVQPITHVRRGEGHSIRHLRARRESSSTRSGRPVQRTRSKTTPPSLPEFSVLYIVCNQEWANHQSLTLNMHVELMIDKNKLDDLMSTNKTDTESCHTEPCKNKTKQCKK